MWLFFRPSPYWTDFNTTHGPSDKISEASKDALWSALGNNIYLLWEYFVGNFNYYMDWINFWNNNDFDNSHIVSLKAERIRYIFNEVQREMAINWQEYPYLFCHRDLCLWKYQSFNLLVGHLWKCQPSSSQIFSSCHLSCIFCLSTRWNIKLPSKNIVQGHLRDLNKSKLNWTTNLPYWQSTHGPSVKWSAF